MKVKALKMLRGANVMLDPGQVADLPPDVALPLIEAGCLERVSETEFAVEPAAERAVVQRERRPEPEKVSPPDAPWPPNKRIKKSPAEYLKAAPEGKWADLARQHMDK